MRTLVQTHRDSLPLPLHEGRSSIWRLADVLDWFQRHQQRGVDRILHELAEVSMTVNARGEAQRLEGNPDDWLAALRDKAATSDAQRSE